MTKAVRKHRIIMGEAKPDQIVPLERNMSPKRFKQLLKSQPKERKQRINILECINEGNEIYTFRMKITDHQDMESFPDINLNDYIQAPDKTIMNLSYTVYYPDRYEEFNEGNEDIIAIDEMASCPLINLLA